MTPPVAPHLRIQAADRVSKAGRQTASVQDDEDREKAFEIVLENNEIADNVTNCNNGTESISGDWATKTRRKAERITYSSRAWHDSGLRRDRRDSSLRRATYSG